MTQKTESVAFGIIGGSGLTQLSNLEVMRRQAVDTPFGSISSALASGTIADKQLAILARHGDTHTIAPQKVNYRANLWAMISLGVTEIIAVNAVGGFTEHMRPGSLVIPDQIIDYTTSRSNTFYETDLSTVTHIDFSYPYNAPLSHLIQQTAKRCDINIISGATYAATEGPRLETAAEIQRLKKDGCDIVGMTAMPEAALARELDINYASICVNANWAAGLGDGLISMEDIEANLIGGMEKVRIILSEIFV